MVSSENLKRKQPSSNPQDGSARTHAKRLKMLEAREIHTQPSDKALNDRKELDVASFVKSREAEIRALEASITSSKSALATRAFQQVPRQLRRRTASHNVKRVPKRLRARASREAREDNTSAVTSRSREPTGKQRLRADIAQERKNARKGASLVSGTAAETAQPQESVAAAADAPILVRKFKKRQLNKSWLPTHMYHAKRAHMTPPLQPLWRYAIPLTPTEKSYRSTHRSSALRGCVAWDTSYMGSIQLTGVEQNLVELLRKLSVPETQLTGHVSHRWLRGVRSWSGWVNEQDNEHRPIAPITVLWSPSDSTNVLRRLLLRVHPSAFLQLWQEVLRLVKMQRPSVTVQDLRFELGSIEISGPAATEALVRVLRPGSSESQTLRQWPSLAAVTDVAILPADVVVGFSVADPRIRQLSKTPSIHSETRRTAQFLEICSTWPPEEEQRPFELLDTDNRNETCRRLMSQKTVNRRKAKTLPGADPPDLPSDPAIPLVLYTMQRKKGGSTTGSWVLLLPWKYVLPVWYCLVHVPLSSGGEPRFGGLHEQRQLSFESSTPWFPGDFPGTQAGWAWEITERSQRKADWEKRPKSKRVQWENVDLGTGERGEVGRGWACDWEILYGIAPYEHMPKSLNSVKNEPSAQSHPLPKNIRQETCVTDTAHAHTASVAALMTVSLLFVNRGHASTCARIYRLPMSDSKLRSAWLALDPRGQRPTQHKQIDDAQTAADEGYPDVPPATDLVGFVTSGNYNLGKGRATAIGSVLIERIQEDPETTTNNGQVSGLCIVREAGVSTGRLAWWKLCP